MDLIKKTRDDYNKIAKHYAVTRPTAWAELNQFKSFIKNGQRILDWGCGHGRLVGLFAGRNVEYHGIDQSREMIKAARRLHAKEVREGRINFHCTEKRPKFFSNNYFDWIFVIASFFHLPDEESRLKLLVDLYKELKPGGHLVMTVWNLGSSWAKQKKKEWKKIGKQDFFIPWKNTEGKVMAMRYYHHFLPAELRLLLKQAGFRVEKIGYVAKGKWRDSKGGYNLLVIAQKS